MSIYNSSEVIDKLKSRLEIATESQIKLATKLKLKIDKKLPKIVYAEKLKKSLSSVLLISESEKAPIGLVNYAKNLAKQLRYKTTIAPNMTRIELNAWINYLWTLQNMRNLQKLKLCPGDLVSIDSDLQETLYIVSSFSEKGLVYFKGGKKKAWASRIKLQCRANDVTESNVSLKTKALNNIELHSRSHEWTLDKERDLKEFCIIESCQEYMLDEFQTVLGKAKDEKPIQKQIELHPELLGSLLTGKPKYLISQKRLGAEFIPDFVMADVDSSGIGWILVELETQNSTVCTSMGKDFDQYVRKGISQIDEWREWLSQNLSYATKSRKENGLGLTGIRPNCDGLILVGRRHLLSEYAMVKRKKLWEEKRIRIRTYDGFIESIENRIQNNYSPQDNWFIKGYNDPPWVKKTAASF